MSESMIERVAEVIREVLRNPPSFSVDMYGRVEADWLARAAIEAMREPTKEMLDAACQVMRERQEQMGDMWFPVSNKVKADIRWRAMIDAALKEKPSA